MSRHRNYCFTLNNYTPEELYKLNEAAELNRYVYICWGYEKCPSTGTPHLQGYVELKDGKTLSAISKEPGFNRMNLRARAKKSNKLKAVTYCAKELGIFIHRLNIKNQYTDEQATERDAALSEFDNMEYDKREKMILKWMRSQPHEWRTFINNIDLKTDKLFFESGDWKHGLKPGTRSDINVVRDIVNSGGNIEQVAAHCNSYQAFRFGQSLLSIRDPTRRWKTTVYWVTGSAGKGKTKFCYDNAIGRVWQSSNSLQWFDGYTGQETVIFDDFRPGHCSLEWLLRLTDRYPLNVPIKGGFTDWCPKIIFITSVMTPEACFKDDVDDEDKGNRQMMRRIRKIFDFTNVAPYSGTDTIDEEILLLEEKALTIEGLSCITPKL